MDDRIKAKTLNVDFDTDGIVVVTWRHPKTGEVAGQSFARFVHTPETVALAAIKEDA